MSKGNQYTPIGAGTPMTMSSQIDSCICSLSLSCKKSTAIYPMIPLPTLHIFDSKQQGDTVTINIISKCTNATNVPCPKAKFIFAEQDKIFEEDLPIGSTDRTVSYQGIITEQFIANNVPTSLLNFFKMTNMPWDMFNEPHTYQVQLIGCHTTSDGYVLVYPTVNFATAIAFEYDFTDGKRADHKPRTEQNNNRISELRKTARDALPKKLHSGWQTRTTKFYLFDQVSLDVDLLLKIQTMEYSLKLKELQKWSKNIENIKDINSIAKIRKLTDSTKNLLPSPDASAKGKVREYKAFSLMLKPIKLGLAYGYIREDYHPKHHFGLVGAPFVGIIFKIDFVQFIAAYCSVETIVSKVRNYLDKNHVTTLGTYIEVEAGAAIEVAAITTQKQWLFDIVDNKNELYLKFKTVIAISFNFDVLFVEGLFQASGSLETKGSFGLDQHNDGLDCVLYHDGIKAVLSLVAEVGISGTRHKSSSKHKHDFVIAKNLTSNESAARFNVLGDSRNIVQPATQPAINQR